MRVSDLAQRAHTTAETVRHYTELGLLTPRRDPDNGYRRYDQTDLQRLGFALKARRLGFTLSDVRELIDESESGAAPCQRVRDLIEQRLEQVEQRMLELRQLSARMRTAMESWSRTPDCHLQGGRVCGLIDSFEAESSGRAG